MSAVIPFYCNPFFRRCKHFFYKKENFFQRKQRFFQKEGRETPKPVPDRCQVLSGDAVKENGSGDGSGQIPQAKIPPADAEGQNQPSPAAAKQKQEVRPLGAFPPQGTQKSVPESQSGTQHQCPEDTPGGHRRGRQPKKRPSQPLRRGS